MEINLRAELKYYIGFCDTKYGIMASNPKIVPGTLIQLNKNSGLRVVYFDVRPFIIIIIIIMIIIIIK